MARRFLTAVAAAIAFSAAPEARAFTMGEVTATTGVQSTLAASGSTRSAGTIAVVQRSLGASVATKHAQLNGGAPVLQGWGGKGAGRGGWAAPGVGAKGWAAGASTGSWASAKAGGGWATVGAGGGGGWSSGPWGGGRAVN